MLSVQGGPLRLIINPRAGFKAGFTTNTQGLPGILNALQRHDISPVVQLTEYPGHARELAEQAVRDGVDLVLVAGGDGTIGEAAQALVNTETTLATIPLGSVMNVARLLGIDRTIDGAVEALVAGHREQIDVGKVGDLYFLEGAGVGINAGIFSYLAKFDKGNWNSLRALIRFVIRYRPRRMTVTVDGDRREFTGYMVGIANAPFVGLLNLAPNASVRDAELDIALFSDFGKAQFVFDTLSLAFGNYVGIRTIRLKGKKVEVLSARTLPVHADNEIVGVTPTTFEVVPGALRVITGPLAGAALATRETPAVTA